MNEAYNMNFKIELMLLGIKQKDFAKRAGLSEHYIWQICNRKKPVTKNVLNKLEMIKNEEL